jgi:hypothetical protein
MRIIARENNHNQAKGYVKEHPDKKKEIALRNIKM